MAVSDQDPMAELSLAIQQGSTLAWVLKYHRAGAADPVQAAWAACQSGTAMREVLGYVSAEGMAAALSLLEPHWGDHDIGDSQSCCADVIRRAVPAGLTLDALLAAITVRQH